MAGHGVYTNKQMVEPLMALDHALIVGVSAPADVRAKRLRTRSPDVVARGAAGTEVLLAHDDVAMAVNVDVLVRNYGDGEATAIDDFIRALAIVLNAAGYAVRGVS